MKLRILKVKQPVEHIHGEILTEKIEFPIEWAGMDASGVFRAYKFRGNQFALWPDGAISLNGEKLELVKAWEIVP